MNKVKKYSPEVRERAVRLVQEHRGEYRSLWAAVASLAPKIGCAANTLDEWVKRAEIDSGVRAGVTSAEAQRISNVLVENAIRPFAVGRRAWLFADTARGARASACCYSLIETSKANGLQPAAYIQHVIEHIAEATPRTSLIASCPGTSTWPTLPTTRIRQTESRLPILDRSHCSGLLSRTVLASHCNFSPSSFGGRPGWRLTFSASMPP